MPAQIEIVPASPAQIPAVRELFEEYWQSFGFTPCFQGFAEELAALPGGYAPPDGALLLALVDGQPAGCVALRRFDATRAEAKRLYVHPAWRGHGLGRMLLEHIFAEAGRLGYSEVLGHTLPVMKDALVLYERIGFERCEPFEAEPKEGAIFLSRSVAYRSTAMPPATSPCTRP
jgi:putative acetyltransferase